MADNKIFAKYTDAETFNKIVDYSSLTDMWESSVKSCGDSLAVIDEDKEYTYAELDAEIAAFRAVLTDHGIKAGDVVGLLAPNSVGFIKAYLAINTIGAAAVLLPAHLDTMTVFGCSMKFGLKGLVYDAALEEKTEIIRAKNPSLPLMTTAETSEKSIPAVYPDENSLSTVIFTGGTTGNSKGARLSHRAVVRGTKNGCYGIKEIFNQRYFLVLPLTHVFGLIRNTLAAFYTGSSLFICRNNKTEALNALGECYLYGKELQKDEKKAVEFFRKAANKGLADAQYNLGYCYEYGYGVEKDGLNARFWYNEAARQGQADATEALEKLK